jgi:hypothetical protein
MTNHIPLTRRERDDCASRLAEAEDFERGYDWMRSWGVPLLDDLDAKDAEIEKLKEMQQWLVDRKALDLRISEAAIDDARAEVEELKAFQVELCRRNLRLQPEYVAKLEAVVEQSNIIRHCLDEQYWPKEAERFDNALRALDEEST